MSQDFKGSPRFKAIFNLAPDIVYTISPDGILTSLSPSFERILGWPASEWVGKSFIPLIHPDDLKLVRWTIKQTMKGKRLDPFILRILTKEETYRTLEFASGPDIIDGKIIGKIGIARDITVHEKEEKEEKFISRATKVLSSSLNYHLTLKKIAQILVPDMADWSSVHIVNEKGELENLTVAHIDPKKVEWALSLQSKYKYAMKDPNNATVRVFNTGQAELYPKITDELIRKSAKNKEERDLLFKLQLRSIIIAPLVGRSKRLGAITLVSSKADRLYDEKDLKLAVKLGRLAGQFVENAKLYMAAKKEIRKRKKVEAELKASRNELKAILENVADGITVFDKDANVTYVNPAIAKSSGYKSQLSMLKNPLKWKDTFKVLDEKGKKIPIGSLPGRVAVLTGKENKRLLHTINKLTGKEEWVVDTARPIITNGIIKGSVSVSHDITERMELERKKDDFISIASHELKTPITSIKGFVHLLKKEHTAYSDSRSAHFIDRIEGQVNNLTELIEDLLNLSKLVSGKLAYNYEEFELSNLIGEVIGDLRAISGSHKIIFKNGIHQKVVADRDRISQVLINLINNAVKYSPGKEKVVVSLKNGGENVKVSVKDYGIGMDESEAENIFDRFYRVKDVNDKTFPGLGIGLYISKEIIERHKGKIWVATKKAKGSTFHFSLPLISA